MPDNTTPTGVNDEVETAPVVRNAEPTERELDMERIASRNAEERDADAAAEAPVELAAATPVAPAEEALDTASQLGKQLEDGQILLDEATLSKAFIKQKIDGREELVPAEKVFRQYQKSAAADLRLADATRMQKEASDLLAQAQKQVANAVTPDERKTAAAAVESAAGFAEKQKELFTALYSGDEDKAGRLLGELVSSTVGAALEKLQPAQVNEDEVANRLFTKFKQRTSVDSALEQLFKDYPEIKEDADMALIADRYVNTFEAEGISRAEAITKAGEALGTKFKIGKHLPDAGRPTSGDALTTRGEKLEKKRALDEPQATSARAVSTAAAPENEHDIIEAMRRARATSMA